MGRVECERTSRDLEPYPPPKNARVAMSNSICVLLLLTCLTSMSACAQDPSVQVDGIPFVKQVVIVETGQKEATAGDLTGDGHLDVVAALDGGSALVQVFLGDSTGAFREADDSPFRLAAGGKMITGGDFNGDGVEDVAITCWDATEVLLLLGGTDSIRTASLPAEGNPWGPTVADLNGDGVDDLVIPDASSDRVVTFASRAE